MKKRKRITTERLATERKWISQFVIASLRAEPGQKTPICDIFDAYQAWLKKSGLGKTELSIDGFGRMFPKHYSRGSSFLGPHHAKFVFGTRLTS